MSSVGAEAGEGGPEYGELQKTMSKEGFCANKAKELLTNTLGGWLDHLGIGRYGAEAKCSKDLMDRKEREWNKEGSESSGQIQRRKAGVGDQIEQGWALTELEYGKMDELGRRRQRVLQTSDKGYN
ncbi:hypothetical protein PPACK8108_LOCUS22702 [Phakopsora pachyrhizi]|uniref:Uncharacterized protein n=1 Tax=Phakopsora pachyrhizi TaxID=170000 RepID=A0AAV0BLB8_PHAPC|nr:hypothetical protein PPACK8108_LOCUS22702 [Phakopsora pachyrhizi]